MSSNYENDRSLSLEKEGNTEDYIDLGVILLDMLHGARRYWYIILLSMAIFSTSMYMYARLKYVPEYTCRVTVILDTNNAVAYGSGDLSTKAMEQLAKAFPYIISNNALKTTIADDLGLRGVPARVYAEPMSNTNMITIIVVGYDPQMTYDVMQSVLKNYPAVAKLVIGDTRLVILEDCEVPREPSNWYNGKKYALVGAFFAFVMCMGVIFLSSVLRKTIRRERDFQDLFNIKHLGSIPDVQTRRHRKAKTEAVLIRQRNVSFEFKEAIRTLRTRIEREHSASGAKVFLITSTLPSEGKSTIAANLAIALAENKQRVLLIDMDLRNPSVAKTMGLDTIEAGIIDILNGKATINDVMVKTKENVICLYGKKASEKDDLIRILNRPKIKGIFDAAKEHVDYILMDTPPCGVFLDAALLAKYADAGIYIVRNNYAPVSRIQEGVARLANENLRICGWVMNRAEEGVLGYGYGYGYGKRYGNRSKDEPEKMENDQDT